MWWVHYDAVCSVGACESAVWFGLCPACGVLTCHVMSCHVRSWQMCSMSCHVMSGAGKRVPQSQLQCGVRQASALHHSAHAARHHTALHGTTLHWPAPYCMAHALPRPPVPTPLGAGSTHTPLHTHGTHNTLHTRGTHTPLHMHGTHTTLHTRGTHTPYCSPHIAHMWHAHPVLRTPHCTHVAPGGTRKTRCTPSAKCQPRSVW